MRLRFHAGQLTILIHSKAKCILILFNTIFITPTEKYYGITMFLYIIGKFCKLKMIILCTQFPTSFWYLSAHKKSLIICYCIINYHDITIWYYYCTMILSEFCFVRASLSLTKSLARFFRRSVWGMWPPLQRCVVWDGVCVALRKTAVMKNSYFYKGDDIRKRETPGQQTGEDREGEIFIIGDSFSVLCGLFFLCCIWFILIVYINGIISVFLIRREELYTETGHHTSKLQHRNR